MPKGLDSKIKVCEVTGLSKDSVADVPIITEKGRNEIEIFNFRGLLEFDDRKLNIATSIGIVYIVGEKLIIEKMCKDEIIIKGIIDSINWKSGNTSKGVKV